MDAIICEKYNFTLEKFVSFMEQVNDTDKIIVDIGGRTIITDKLCLINTLFMYSTVDDDTECYIATDNIAFMFLGIDFNWWIKTNKRKEKLKNWAEAPKPKAKKQKVETENTVIYSVAVAETSDEPTRIPVDIASKSGCYKDCLAFINDEIRRRTLRTFYKAQIIICLDYHDDSNDSWKTIEQLVEEDKITM